MIQLDKNKLVDGVYYLSSISDREFDDEMYIALRKKEGRLYSGEQIKKLPYIKLNNELDKEWKVRAETFEKLVKYFRAKEGIDILEIGCGNGWLSNGISSKTNNYAAGIDLNKTELIQAANIFNENKNVNFVYGNIFENIFHPQLFDAVIFASSIQYFRNFSDLIKRVFFFLKEKGEVHIVDSNFYHKCEKEAAKLRTIKYYNDSGFPEMSLFYHHHDWDDLKIFNFTIMNQSRMNWIKVKNRISKNKNVIFPWIRIIKV